MAQHQKKISRIGLYTSGGDAPGMNAAIRAVVRVAHSLNIEVMGIYQGYIGLIENIVKPLHIRDVANIIQRGGTILKTGRSSDFHKAEIRAKAVDTLKAHNIDGLICIGGDGSFRGAYSLWKEHQIPIVGIPGTIDNDIFGSDLTIGFDTAVNTALDAIDKIRDTADSHDRVFIVEVMGRNSGFIACHVGLAGGAEEIFVPDGSTHIEKSIERIKDSIKKGKHSSILITAEGQKPGRAYDLADAIRKKSGIDPKICILGHIQRGGSPTSVDRVLASRMGSAAIDNLHKGFCDIMIGSDGPNLVQVPFELATTKEKRSPIEYVQLSQILAV
ncbi:MAG: 6-phosphofructokinase [Bdellovibrionaceae bacterium]|nr:6-phosphofructokinase [Pseudobdellovibrionaceae bacterium]